MTKLFEKLEKIFKQVFFHKRMKSLYWGSAMMTISVLVDVLLESYTTWGMSDLWVVFVGLILAQISKGLNNWKQMKPM